MSAIIIKQHSKGNIKSIDHAANLSSRQRIAGIITQFSSVFDGIEWFQSRDQWQELGSIPSLGDLIFMDWEGDGGCDHVAIVESCDGTAGHTIKGNSHDTCMQKSYSLGSLVIFGYGVVRY